MPIKFKCPSCDQTLAIATRKAGTVISCPRCSYPATVPNNEGEIARPAAARPQPARPVFERGDFDRWIGGRRPSGGATMLAEPPAASLPTLSETHSGLLDAHRDRRARESTAPVIDIRLAIALILGLGLLAFGGGFWLGRNSSFTKPTHAGAVAPPTDATKPAAGPNETAAAPAPKYVLNGVVQYRAAGKDQPDVGARVLAFPINQKPLKRIMAGGLRPGDEKGLDQTGVDALAKFGGAAATVDVQGRYSVTLPKEGVYWILVISKNLKLASPRTLQPEEQKLLNYFADVPSMIGDKDFALARRTAMGDGPVTPLNSLFTPPTP